MNGRILRNEIELWIYRRLRPLDVSERRANTAKGLAGEPR
jgi:hypothetical protein